MAVRVNKEGAAPVAEAAPETAKPAKIDRKKTIRVTDSEGRIIGIRLMGIVQRMRLMEIVGAENTRNESYFGNAALAGSATEIDGEALDPITSKGALEVRLALLDDHGLEAVADGLAKHFVAPDDSPEDLAKNG